MITTRFRSSAAALALVCCALGPLAAPASAAEPPPPSAGAVCHKPQDGAALARLQRAMVEGRFIAYQPTQIRVYDGRPTMADEAGIEADLRALRGRFDSLLTYGSANGAERVADVAARLGFRAVIPGIWSVDDAREVGNALDAARRHPGLVPAVSLGNERIFAKERSFGDLASRLAALRQRAPQLAFTTTEPFHMFVMPEARPLLAQMDFMLANVHPAFQPWFPNAGAADAARFVVNVTGDLARAFCGPVLVKETGLPTAPPEAGYSPQRQADFFAELRRQFPPTRERAFAYFSAFDAAWRVHDEHAGVKAPQPQEGSWGLWDEERRPKPAALAVPPLPRRP